MSISIFITNKYCIDLDNKISVKLPCTVFVGEDIESHELIAAKIATCNNTTTTKLLSKESANYDIIGSQGKQRNKNMDDSVY